jgi:PBP1b-binding outer membrane lipoprotein LpoB
MKMFNLLIVISIAMLLSSCMRYGQTIPSVTDPAFRGVDFSKFCVEIQDYDLESSIMFESNLVEEIRNYNSVAGSSVRMMPPTRDWSEKKKYDFLRKNRFDAYLVITREVMGFEDVVIPAKEVFTTTRKAVSETVEEREIEPKKKKDKTRGKKKNDKKAKKETITRDEEIIEEKLIKTESHVVRYFDIKFDYVLYDVITGRIAWMATREFSSKNEDMIPYRDIDDIAFTLYQEGLIRIGN